MYGWRERSWDRLGDRGGDSGQDRGSNQSLARNEDQGAPADDEDREACTVWIGGCPRDITEQDIHEVFSKHGPVREINIKHGRTATYAFVIYTRECHAHDAIRALHESTVFGVTVKVVARKGYEGKRVDGKSGGKGKMKGGKGPFKGGKNSGGKGKAAGGKGPFETRPGAPFQDSRGDLFDDRGAGKGGDRRARRFDADAERGHRVRAEQPARSDERYEPPPPPPPPPPRPRHENGSRGDFGHRGDRGKRRRERSRSSGSPVERTEELRSQRSERRRTDREERQPERSRSPKVSAQRRARQKEEQSIPEPEPATGDADERRRKKRRRVRVRLENLPSDMLEDELLDICGQYGDVRAYDLRRKGRAKHGFVEYRTRAEADKAIDELDDRHMDEWDMRLKAFLSH